MLVAGVNYLMKKCSHTDAAQGDMRRLIREYLVKHDISRLKFSRSCSIGETTLVRFLNDGGKLSDGNFEKVQMFFEQNKVTTK